MPKTRSDTSLLVSYGCSLHMYQSPPRHSLGDLGENLVVRGHKVFEAVDDDALGGASSYAKVLTISLWSSEQRSWSCTSPRPLARRDCRTPSRAPPCRNR